MGIMKLPLDTTDLLRICGVVFFGFLVVVTLLSVVPNHVRRWYCSRRGKAVPEDIFEKRAQMAGGYAVLLFALVANQGFVYTAAVFIAGRLIAPEQFLLLLASILRGGNHAASIAKGIMAMDRTEKDKKIDEDIEDDDDSPTDPDDTSPPDTPTNPSGPPAAEPSIVPHRVNANEVMLLERKLLAMMQARIHSDYLFLSYAKVRTGDIYNAYDGIVVDRSSSKVKIAFEIKYRSTMNPSGIRQILRSIEPIITDAFPVIVLVIFASQEKRNLTRLLEIRQQFKSLHPSTGLAYYFFDKDTFSAINDEDISTMLQQTGVASKV